MPMTPGPESSKTAIAAGSERPRTNAPRTDAMTTRYVWAFRATLRRRAFGWSGTGTAGNQCQLPGVLKFDDSFGTLSSGSWPAQLDPLRSLGSPTRAAQTSQSPWRGTTEV